MIYLDMDGVLTDLDKGLENLGLHRNKELMSIPESSWTEDQKLAGQEIRDQFKRKNFFADLPAMSDIKSLWDYCLPYRPVILTARPGLGELGDDVARQKKEWVEKNLGSIEDNQFICCLRSEKQNFIGHTDHHLQILVDDMEINCKEWVTAGGRAVIHTSAEDTIRKLDRIIFQDESVGVVI